MYSSCVVLAFMSASIFHSWYHHHHRLHFTILVIPLSSSLVNLARWQNKRVCRSLEAAPQWSMTKWPLSVNDADLAPPETPVGALLRF